MERLHMFGTVALNRTKNGLTCSVIQQNNRDGLVTDFQTRFTVAEKEYIVYPVCNLSTVF